MSKAGAAAGRALRAATSKGGANSSGRPGVAPGGVPPSAHLPQDDAALRNFKPTKGACSWDDEHPSKDAVGDVTHSTVQRSTVQQRLHFE